MMKPKFWRLRIIGTLESSTISTMLLRCDLALAVQTSRFHFGIVTFDFVRHPSRERSRTSNRGCDDAVHNEIATGIATGGSFDSEKLRNTLTVDQNRRFMGPPADRGGN